MTRSKRKVCIPLALSENVVFSFFSGRFQMEFLGEESGGDTSGEFLRVAVICPHVHHAGDPASVPCRERAFIDRDAS